MSDLTSSPGLTRRTALKAGAATLGAAASRPRPRHRVGEGPSVDDFLQKHYKELGLEDLKKVLDHHTAAARKRTGRDDIRITDTKAIPGVQFAYALNLTLCIGCRKCADACHKENNHDRPSHNSYIRVPEMEQGTFNLEGGQRHLHPSRARRRCSHAGAVPALRERPCTRVCPVEATWTEPDGIVVSITTGASAAATAARPVPTTPAASTGPSRSFRRGDQSQPGIPSNRIRPQGVMEKCTFCLHRTRNGRLPACLEACPTGARVFGNLLDPDSEISWVLANKRVFVLKEELGTRPRFFYFFDK
ncbi:MAG: 4Fe-4S dicluster domain-containing protein [Kiritimatiellia bacterium]